MITVPVTEANQNFTKITKLVDENGAVVLTYRGKEKYVLSSIKDFETRGDLRMRMIDNLKEGFYANYKHEATGDEGLLKMKQENGLVHIEMLSKPFDDAYGYYEARIPLSELTITDDVKTEEKTISFDLLGILKYGGLKGVDTEFIEEEERSEIMPRLIALEEEFHGKKLPGVKVEY